MIKAITQKALCKLPIVWAVAALLCWVTTAHALTLDDFQEVFNKTKENGTCLTFTVDDCNVIAVKNLDVQTEAEIALIFVQNKSRQKSTEVAQRILKALGNAAKDCEIQDFTNNDGSVVIFCPVAYASSNSTLRTLLYPLDKRGAITFSGWNGSRVRATIDMENAGVAGKKKVRGTLKLEVDLTESFLNYAQFQYTKGNATTSVIKDYILERIFITPPSAGNYNSLSSRSKKELRSLYGDREILVYNSAFDFCLLSKGRNFYAGTLDDVKKDKPTKHNFKFPDEPFHWEDEHVSKDEDTKAADTEPVSKREPIMNKASSPVPLSSLKQKFPDLEIADGGLLYTMRLDNSRIYVVTKIAKQIVTYILVRSSVNQADALATANRLAKEISDKCVVRPFMGHEPAAVIFMPWVEMTGDGDGGNRYFQLLLTPYETCPDTTQFVEWKGGLIVTRLTSDEPGAKGVVEATTKLSRIGMSEGAELKVISGKIDILTFLKNRHIDLSKKPPTAEDKTRLKAELECEDVLYYSKYDNDDNSYLLISCGDNIYRSGTKKVLRAMKETGEIPWHDYNFSATASRWPGEREANKDSSPAQTTGATSEAAHSEQMNNVSASRWTEHIIATPAHSAEKSLTPEAARKQYIKSLQKLK